ncbi:MAG TPA: HEAT repeat domain-containing protein [Planctomycetota bacterium]|nr:HEAT repeat domain-containing protein [Planctomycetota bacterium]
MNPTCNILETRVACTRRAVWIAAALLMAVGSLHALEGEGKLTTPERLAKFNAANPHVRLELMGKLVQPEDPKDFERYKIPDFLIKTLKDTDEDPRVRDAALQGMVLAITKYDISYRSQFIPAFLDVLSEKQVGLVQEYVLIASPSAVDPDGPGPNKLLLNKIAAISDDGKMTGDNEVRLRVQSIIALGQIGNKDYLDKFFKLMGDSNKEIVTASIKAVDRFLRTAGASHLELTVNQLATLTTLLKAKETPVESKSAILRTLGVNARNFRRSHPQNQLAPGVNEVMAEVKTILNPPQGTELPPFFVVGDCIETLGMYGHKDAVDLIKLIFHWDYLKVAEGQTYRVQAVDVVDQVIAANIGDGKAFNQTVEDTAGVLMSLLGDEKEDSGVRKAAAFYLADVRFKCYKRDLYFNELFIHAYTAPDAKTVTLDEGLAVTCKKSMEVIAGRTFPPDYVYADFVAWWLKVGKTELAQQK